MNAIEIRGVTKQFGSITAVNDLTLDVPEGAIYGFIGPNGSRKTTTIRMIMNIILPDSGVIGVLGRHSAVSAPGRGRLFARGTRPLQRGMAGAVVARPGRRDHRRHRWAASRIFRIGILMQGKAPNLPELLRWIKA